MNDSIFKPHFNITPEVTNYLQDIDRQVWLIDNMLLMPKHEAWIRRDVSIKRAAGTTQIEGANLDEAAVSKLVSRGAGGRYNEDEQANINALEAYEFIDFLSEQKDIPIDELVIRELNRKFMNNAAATLTPGVYRKGQNMVGNFTPPDQGDVPDLMRSFALWLRDEDDDIHPILKAGVAHIHLVAIHPFWDGNGRTTRGLSTLILQRSPFGFRKLLSSEDYLFENRDLYFSAIDRTLGSKFTVEYDATAWLEFFAGALYNHALELVAGLTDWHRSMEQQYKNAEAKGWDRRYADGVTYALRTGSISRSEYIEVTGVSPVTASRDLAQLVEAEMLIPEGKTRSRIYRPAPEKVADKDRIPEEQLPLLSDSE